MLNLTRMTVPLFMALKSIRIFGMDKSTTYNATIFFFFGCGTMKIEKEEIRKQTKQKTYRKTIKPLSLSR